MQKRTKSEPKELANQKNELAHLKGAGEGVKERGKGDTD